MCDLTHNAGRNPQQGQAGFSSWYIKDIRCFLDVYGDARFIRETLCVRLQRAQTNRWVCVWQWKENPSLSEAQVQGMALARQATIDMELKHREAVYRDILNKQQTVISSSFFF